jgi:hypothetical protein
MSVRESLIYVSLVCHSLLLCNGQSLKQYPDGYKQSILPLKNHSCTSILANGFQFIITIILWQTVSDRAPKFVMVYCLLWCPPYGSHLYRQSLTQKVFLLCT